MMACLFDPSGIRWWKSGVLVSGSNKMIAATFDGATFTHTIRRWLGWIRLINGHGIDDTDTAIGANYGSHVIVVCRVGVLYVSTYNDSLLCGCGTLTHVRLCVKASVLFPQYNRCDSCLSVRTCHSVGPWNEVVRSYRCILLYRVTDDWDVWICRCASGRFFKICECQKRIIT